MDPKKSKYVNTDNDYTYYTSKSKTSRSKNKSKSKKTQSPIDKINSITTISNSQNTHDFQSNSSSSSSKSLLDKKKSSHNKKSDNSSTIQKRYIPSKKESISNESKTSILLGFPDGNISTQEDNDPYSTKIGGKPNWLLESHPLSHDAIICKNCDKDMFLLFQGYVPLEDSIYDRVIYIFGCNQHKCVKKNGR
jgi:pre-rRNA-processing protein TSR4